MTNGRPVSTPIDPNVKLVKLAEAKSNVKEYQSALGALMYAMLATRPDIAFAVRMLSKHAATPGQEHMTALKRVYRYLRGTSDAHLIFRGDAKNELLGYVDADWAADINDRRSVTGYIFILAGAAISWLLKKQSSVALSSTKAEYMAATAATKEAVWLRKLFDELATISSCPTMLLIDNQSAKALAKNAMFHDRTKHIAIRHHFIREKLDSGEIAVDYVLTSDQTADILTKGLTREKHVRFSVGMGISF